MSPVPRPSTVVRLPFADRVEAGRLLGEAVRERLGVAGPGGDRTGREQRGREPLGQEPDGREPSGQEPLGGGVVVLGIPRGGVVVAAEVADVLGAPLDVVVARKIGAPWQRELAIGAATADGTVMIEPWAREVSADERYVAEESARQAELAREQEARLRDGRARIPLAGRVAVVVDDGIATGATMHVAILASRTAGASRIVVAVPVGPRESIERLAATADEAVVLATPAPFFAVGEFYVAFRQTTDEEVIGLLAARRG
jgi:putative phosphoribosyl transferase